jgi:hypothetical protein
MPGFRRFWVAATVSDFGTAVTTLALQVLVVVTLDGSATEVGLVSAARWLPYLVLGVLVGVLADRPALAGALIPWLGAPVALLVDAVSYLVSGLLTAAIRVQEPAPDRTGPIPSIPRRCPTARA